MHPFLRFPNRLADSPLLANGTPMGGRGGSVLLPPTANMAAWFRKGVGITSAASAVSAWADQSGNGRNYAQATGANQPDVTASGTILMNGSTDFLKTAGFTLAQPYTRYLRLKMIAWALSDYICDGLTVNTGVIYQHFTNPALKAYAGADSPENTDLAVGAWGSLSVVFNGASSVFQVGANAPKTGNFGAANPGGLTLGAAGNGTTGFANIEVAEEIVYSVAHDATQRAAVIAYLNSVIS